MERYKSFDLAIFRNFLTISYDFRKYFKFLVKTDFLINFSIFLRKSKTQTFSRIFFRNFYLRNFSTKKLSNFTSSKISKESKVCVSTFFEFSKLKLNFNLGISSIFYIHFRILFSQLSLDQYRKRKSLTSISATTTPESASPPKVETPTELLTS
jgi:hypothetical protein